MTKSWWICLVCGLLAGVLQAQDPLYSQFFAAPLQVNPAFAGVTQAPRLTLNYRNQYPGWPNAYLTYSAAYEQNIDALNSGLGVMVMSDSEGDGVYKTNYASAVYSYRVQLNRSWYAKFGLEAGLMQVSVDWDRLVFGDQLDPLNGPTDPGGNPNPSFEQRPDNLRATAFDVSAGVLFYGGPVYVGLSLKHLNTPDPSVLDINDNLRAGRPLRAVLHAGAEFPLTPGNIRRGGAFISPNMLLARQGDFTQLNLGAYLGAGRMFGGLWFRHTFGNPDAAILAVGVREGVLRVGYSYDWTVSGLAAAPGGGVGAHELSVTVNLGDSKRIRRQKAASRWSDCLNMFR